MVVQNIQKDNKGNSMKSEDFIKNEEIKLETKNKYYYKGRVRKINEDSIMIRDVRGIKTLIFFKDIDFIIPLLKRHNNYKNRIYNKTNYNYNLNKKSYRIHNDERPKS